MTPASTRTWDRWTEARTGPGPLCPRNGRRPRTIQGTCDDTASWPPRRPADGQQRAALRERVTGHQEGSRGLINPSRRMFSTAPARGLSSWCLRVSLKSLSGEMTSMHMFGPSMETRSCVCLWMWSFLTSLVCDGHLFGAVSPETYRILNTSGDDFRSCFRILGSTADRRAHASVH